MKIFIFTLLFWYPKKFLQNLFELPQRIVKMKSYVHFPSTKTCKTLRPLRAKNSVKIYWQDPLGSKSSGNLQDLLMIINIQEDPLGFLQVFCKTHKIFTRFLYDLNIVINVHKLHFILNNSLVISF